MKKNVTVRELSKELNTLISKEGRLESLERLSNRRKDSYKSNLNLKEIQAMLKSRNTTVIFKE